VIVVTQRDRHDFSKRIGPTFVNVIFEPAIATSHPSSSPTDDYINLFNFPIFNSHIYFFTVVNSSGEQHKRRRPSVGNTYPQNINQKYHA
jgi:hypothetical protein